MSVTAPEGFVAAGGAGGIKADGKADLALVATASRAPAPAAAVFTSNLAAAAPVRVSQEHLTSTAGMAAAVILNSGNANAATGPEGVQVARSMCAMTAGALGLDTEAVLVCSTGLIGAPLSLAPIQTALPRLVRVLGPDSASGEAAARAIMTTDTFPKQVRVDRPGFVVGGMAKGAAMLAPNMATMLAVLTTDAVLEPTDLQPALHKAVEESFNLLSIDGCTSTNDTVMVLTSAK
ncbi:MAG: bifunctional ornithine acetyltransferase/N-acetylglutamate synthase, partial [Acidimicrobiales bacterium]